ncbi:MAG: DUF4954 family protein [Prolixibacteraceae bacterium]|nr:DUF4954 family protein [Prolixibacteraceae bacterium]
MSSFRKLTLQEITVLENNSNKAESWDTVSVSEYFNPENIANSRFSGEIKLGNFKTEVEFPGGVKKKSGIYNSVIHNCEIGDNTYINNTKNYIANYKIGANVIIENPELIVVTEKTSFGNRAKIDVLDETGGRQIPIYEKLSSPLAYILTFYRHLPGLISELEGLIRKFAEEKSSLTGVIGDCTSILNSGQIKNTNIGDHAQITGVSRLNNGTVNSTKEAPVIIGDNVVADNFIISSGSEVTDSVVITNCFIGQGCILSKHYSAVHSLFFANCQGFNGEACSVFAGPFTVTHHKSTLLIAGMFSFLNAGSGSNQSNHMYKLGPIHHGVIERGSKTTSDSYLLWPSRIGAFSLVMGRHYKNSDTTDMPFSYFIENKDESWLAPAINLRSVGTIRDVLKWPKRDKRKGKELLDSINYNLLSPYTIKGMVKGQEILKQLKKVSGDFTDTYTWQTTFIRGNALDRGIRLYEMAITKFIGNSVISRINNCKSCKTYDELLNFLKPSSSAGKGEWIDLAGLIAPKSEVDVLISKIENKKFNTLKSIEGSLKKIHQNYYEYEWAWALELFEKRTSKKLADVSKEDLINLVHNWIECVVGLDEMLYEDAKKEFALNSMTGFGIDGDYEVKKQDFEKVRGTFEQNAFVQEILSHIQRKTELGQSTISFLQKLT